MKKKVFAFCIITVFAITGFVINSFADGPITFLDSERPAGSKIQQRTSESQYNENNCIRFREKFDCIGTGSLSCVPTGWSNWSSWYCPN